MSSMIRLASHLLLSALALAVPLGAQEAGDAPAREWPQSIQDERGTVTLYQPQPETLEGDQLTARAAVGFLAPGKGEPIFGAVWITARVETDRAERMVYVRDVSVPRVRFPGSTPEQEAVLAKVLADAIQSWNLELSLDRLLTSLESARTAQQAATDLDHTPPRILHRSEPTVLVLIDGEPRLSKVAGTNLMRVLNTPFLVVFDGDLKRYFLFAGTDAWFAAGDLQGAWTLVEQVPAEVAALAPDPAQAPSADPAAPQTGDALPTVLVATVPTELLQTEGAAQYTPVAENELMYVSNTSDTILLEVATQRTFALLSGRWYATDSLDEGPWTYVSSDELPQAFRAIPEDSPIGSARAFVPGTDQALDAVLDAQIPQTAQVDRKTAGLQVTYDGEPRFEPIASTQLGYAVNTATAVLRSGQRYYACSEGVWFVASSPSGAWAVATERPPGVDAIPASCPVYNVKYVYIYQVTPTVVYVGYTPGYTGCYVYNGTVVYGTGYTYPGWYGVVYYPRPVTWGFAVRWNPYTGWGYGVTYSWGRMTFGMGYGSWCAWHGGWWGPASFYGYQRGYGHGYQAGFGAGYVAGARRANLYQDIGRTGVRPPARPTTLPARGAERATTRPAQGAATRDLAARQRPVDSTLADREGNVMRRNEGGGWDSLSGRDAARQPAAGSQPSTRPAAGLDREYQNRQRGQQRTQNFQRSRGGGRGRR